MKLSRSMRSFAELVAMVAGALFFALVIQAYAVKPYSIPSGSMLPTLHVGQRLIVDRFSHQIGGDPKIGDITVFKPPAGSTVTGGNQCGVVGEGPSNDGPASHRACSRATPGTGPEPYIKRVVGLPGDVITIKDGHVIRNGRVAREPFAAPCGGGSECTLETVIVPPGHYYLMGDNRGDSDDSRYWGPVARDEIIGHAVATYWPPSRIGTE